jgi:hypothetical protein
MGNEEVSLVFEVTLVEQEVANKWIKEQKEKHPQMSQGRFGYEFTPTGIGDGKSVFDNLTGERKDITDYDNW